MRIRGKPDALTVILLVANLILGNVFRVYAQAGCTSAPFSGQSAGVVGSDGKRHIRVAAPAATDMMFWAVQSAMNKWNEHSGTTGVVFEYGEPVDLTFEQSSDWNLSMNCIRTDRAAQKVYYEPAQCLTSAEYQFDSMANALAHEFGHFLGMTHSDLPGVLMYKGDEDWNCEDNLNNRANLGVTGEDAALANSCLSQSTVQVGGQAYEENRDADQGWQICHQTWYIEPIYSCTGSSCQIVGYFTTMLSEWCEPVI